MGDTKEKTAMSMNYGLTYEQKQLLSQTQIQSLKLLSMCNTELDSFLNNEYLENPLLDHREGEGAPGMTEEFDAWHQQNQSFNEGYGDSDKNESCRREAVPVEEGRNLSAFLKDQMHAGKYSEKEWKVIDFLIMNLGDDGLYRTSVEESARAAGVPADMVQKCLEDLRQLEPTGIFAEDLPACLLRQLEVLGVEDENLKEIIRTHLKDASQGRISNITRHLNISSVQARKYIAFIGTLNPKPLSGFSAGGNSYIIPDILFQRKDNDWEITLNDNWMGDYHLNDYYLKMIAESQDKELQDYFKKKLERARLILSGIEQRRRTVLSVSQAILDWQRAFFEENKELVPMTMKELADQLEISASTVSRAVNGKYVQYPGGTVLMKNLFQSPASDQDGNRTMTAGQVKKIVKQLIDSENKKKPYSDQALADLAREQGISISRRAVAKYREEMGIAGSFQRKQQDAE